MISAIFGKKPTTDIRSAYAELFRAQKKLARMQELNAQVLEVTADIIQKGETPARLKVVNVLIAEIQGLA